MEEMTVEELRAYLDALRSPVYVPGQGFRVEAPGGAQVLSVDELKAAVDAVEAQIDAQTTSFPERVGSGIAGAARAIGRNLTSPAVSPAERRQQEIAAGQSKLSKANQKLIDDYLNAERKVQTTAQEVAGVVGTGPQKTQADIDRWVEAAAKAKEALAKKGLTVTDDGYVTRNGSAVAVVPKSAPPGTVTGTSRGTPRGVAGPLGPVRTGPETVSGAPSTAALPVGTATPPAGTSMAASGTAASVAAGGTTAGTASGAAATRRRPSDPDAWKKILQQYFPSYSDTWTNTDAMNTFGQDLLDLMTKAADPNGVYDLNSAEGRERFKAELRGTTYWRTTVEAARSFDQMVDADRNLLVKTVKDRIASTYGDLNFDEVTLNDVAFAVARNGLTGASEKQAVYNTLFQRKNNPRGMQDVLKGEDATALRRLGKAYGYNVTDAQIQSVLSGTPEPSTGQTLTADALRQRMRLSVKGAMPHLSEQIDAGLTLDDIGGSYRRYAAQLLERDENEIDMMNGPYMRAFGDPKNGQMSLSEWTRQVKSDPVFGWQYTKQANDQATDIALSLARAFGKVT